MMYESSKDLHLNRAIEEIKIFQQVFKRELEKKDETIGTLQRRFELLQYEYNDFKQAHEEEYRTLSSTNQVLKNKLSEEQAKNERLREEIIQLHQEVATQKSRVLHFRKENEKANHIIKTLYNKSSIRSSQSLQI